MRVAKARPQHYIRAGLSKWPSSFRLLSTQADSLSYHDGTCYALRACLLLPKNCMHALSKLGKMPAERRAVLASELSAPCSLQWRKHLFPARLWTHRYTSRHASMLNKNTRTNACADTRTEVVI